VAEASGAQAACFAEPRDRGATSTRIDRRLCDGRGTHAVRLSFDDGGDAPPRPRRGLESTDVVGNGVQVNFDPAQHSSIVKRP
jgi:hypothetical protein